jgi:hypothetical protein
VATIGTQTYQNAPGVDLHPNYKTMAQQQRLVHFKRSMMRLIVFLLQICIGYSSFHNKQ